MAKLLPYLLPFIPFVPRLLFLLRFRSQMRETLTDGERQLEAHRTLISAMMSFTFAGLLALTIADAQFKLRLRLPVYFILVCFVCYYFAFNLQAYKFFRWLDLLSDALTQTASLCLMLCIASTALSYGQYINGRLITALSLSVWLIDEAVRLLLVGQLYKKREKRRKHPPPPVIPETQAASPVPTVISLALVVVLLSYCVLHKTR